MNFISHLSSDLILKHIEQCHEIWGGGLSVKERFDRHIMRLNEAGPELFFMSGMLSSEGALISSLKRYYISLEIKSKKYKCVGLGAIYTDAQHRKSGAASELIQKVLNQSKSEFDCDFAILFSDIGPSYYEKFSFQAVPAFNWIVKISDLEEKIKNTKPLNIRKTEGKDIPLLKELYEKLSATFEFKTLRSEKSWKLFREINSIENTYILSSLQEDVGFFSISPQKEYLWIDEALVDTKFELALWATLQKIANEKNLSELRAWNLKAFQPNSHKIKTEILERTRAIPMLASLRGVDATIPHYKQILENAYIAAPDHM
jgi:predicted N-acetyltransferase YhbS